MKKLMLIVAGSLFIGGLASYAQDTTSTYRSKQQMDQSRTKTTDKNDHTMKSGQDMKGDQSMKGWTRVNTAEVPASLRSTLSSPQYNGWEKSSVYVNQAGDRYYVRLGDASSPKTYYFDKTGKPVEGMMNDQNNLKK